MVGCDYTVDHDRISSINPSSAYILEMSPRRISFLSSQTQSVELCSSFTLLSPNAVLRLRFPIPDLRPPPLRRPPSQRAVREETLVLELTELELKHQEAPDLQSQQPAPGQQWGPCLTQLLEASFIDMHGEGRQSHKKGSSWVFLALLYQSSSSLYQHIVSASPQKGLCTGVA